MATIFLKFLGFDRMPINVTSKYLVEEMSRTRHFTLQDFVHSRPTDAAHYIMAGVSLKESGTRIYKTDSLRDPMDSVFLPVPPSAAVEAAADDKIFYESQELLEQNILEANEEIEVLKRETADNATTISRTDSESERRMCLENNRSLKERLYHADLRLTKLWNDLKILFENRAESHFPHMLDDINRAAVILSTGSKAVIESHVQDWKIARSENVKEKTGIQLCLDKVSQSKRTPVLKSDISYRKTLIEKMVETESQIRDYNTRIQKAEDILRSRSRFRTRTCRPCSTHSARFPERNLIQRLKTQPSRRWFYSRRPSTNTI
jgi:hypothetical protein